MKKTTQKKMPIMAALIVATLLGVTLVAALPLGSKTVSDEDKEAMITAIENNDYETWKSLMNSQLTEERFNQITERHQFMQEHKEKVEAAIEAGDYSAWKEAVSINGRNPKITEVITEDNFPTFLKMHEAMKSGDTDTAKTLAEELGLNAGMGRHFGMGCGKVMMQTTNP